MLPISYIDAGVRCVLPVCPERGRIGFAFDLDCGPVVRLALTPQGASTLRAMLGDYINSLALNQSPGSLLSPIDPVSVPSEGVNT